MIKKEITIFENSSEITITCYIASTFFEKLLGLFAVKLNSGEHLLIKNCNQIHTFFLKRNIDIIVINSDNQVIDRVTDLRPWKISKKYWKKYGKKCSIIESYSKK